MEKIIQATLTRLRDELIARLPGRIAALQSLLDAAARGEKEALGALHREAHSLVGIAGAHRLKQICDEARKLELMVAAVPADRNATETEMRDMRESLTELMAHSNQPLHNFVPFPVQRPASQHIVIVDDDAEQAIWLRTVLEQAGYHVEVFSSLNAFRSACDKQSVMPAAVIMDMVFPEGDDAGARIVKEMKTKCISIMPVIFLSVRDDMAAKLAAYRAGASRYLTKPVDRETLLQVVGESASLKPAEPYRVMLVDDDPDQLAVYTMLLRQAGIEVRETTDPLQVPQMLEDFPAEALLMDMYMQQCSGPELAAILRDDARHTEKPIIYLSTETEISKQLLALDRAGDYFLTKPVEPDHLIAAVLMHTKRFRQSKEQSEMLRSSLYERERQQQALDAHAIVSTTDTDGNIISVNDKFCKVSGYSREELIGSNHRIVKSNLHAPDLYSDLWRTIKSGRIWHGEICNMRKDGSLYWVETSIVPFLDSNGKPYQYISIRTDITRIKEAASALQESETRFRNMADQAPALIWLADTQNLGTWYNKRWLEYTGRTMEQELGLGWTAGMHPDDLDKSVQCCTEAFNKRHTFEMEFRLRRADGSYGWIADTGIPRFSDKGEFEGYIGYCWDITARKQAEAARQEALDRLNNIASQVPGIVYQFRLRPDGTASFPYASLAMRDIIGVDPQEVREDASKAFAAILQDDMTNLMDSIRASARDLTAWRHEFRVKNNNGEQRWLYGESSPKREEDGSVLWHGFITDITVRKQSELALAESRARLEAAQAQAHLGNWDSDMNTGKAQWSTETYRIFGQDPACFTPSAKAFFDAVHPEDREMVMRNGSESAKTGIFDFVHRIIRPNGEVRHVHQLAKVQVDSEGKLTKLSGTVQDVTELKLAEQALIKAKEEAESASRAKSEFLASMSHELRTPLNAILGFSQLFAMNTQLPAETRDNAREIERAGQHLLSLVNDMIDLARIESGKLELSLEPVPVRTIVKDSLSMVASLSSAQGIDVIEADCSEGEITVMADYVRLRQVTINLLTNAIKYNRPQGSVRVSCQVDGDEVRINVADTGIGIPADKQPRIFNSFDRLGVERGNIEGTGIGLVITKRIVEAMGGAIGFESSEGKGSTFWIIMPLTETNTSHGMQNLAEAPDTPKSTSIAGSSEKSAVLYIEDNPMNMRLMQQIFASRKNLELRDAHTAEIGIRMAYENPPALILMDINLPGMDGYKALTFLKADERTAHIPIIAISANAMAGDRERGLNAGFADYLTKPLNVQRLFDVLDGQLNSSGD